MAREKAKRDPRVYADLEVLVKLRAKAKGFSFLPRQPLHSVLSGKHASRLRGRGLDFEEIRRYLPGDDIRTVDAKVTARTRRLHVRVYNEERDRPAFLVVDQRTPMFFGSDRAMKSVVAAEAAALGAWRVLEQGDRVGAVVFGDEELVTLRPNRSRRAVLRMLHEIVSMNHRLAAGPSTGEGMLDRALEQVGRVASHDALIVIISDFDGAGSETRRLMTRLAAHNDVVAILVYDRLESRLPSAGRLVVAQGDLQLEVDTSQGKLRKGFAASFDQRLVRTREFLMKLQVPVIPLHTGAEVAAQVRRHLGQRPRGAGR